MASTTTRAATRENFMIADGQGGSTEEETRIRTTTGSFRCNIVHYMTIDTQMIFCSPSEVALILGETR